LLIIIQLCEEDKSRKNIEVKKIIPFAELKAVFDCLMEVITVVRKKEEY